MKYITILLLFLSSCGTQKSTQKKIIIIYDSEHWTPVPMTKEDSLLMIKN